MCQNKTSLQNLIPFNEMLPEQHRELSRLGGIRSGEVRRHKQSIKKLFYEIMSRGDLKIELIAELKEFYRWKNKKAKHAEQWEEFEKWRKREARKKRERTVRKTQ